MKTRFLYQFEICFLAISLWSVAHAQGIKPQVMVDGSAVQIPVEQLPQPAPIQPLGGANGAPIVYPSLPVSQSGSASSDDESQALMNAFGLIMNAFGGGQAGYGSGSEIVDGSGDEDYDYGNAGSRSDLVPVDPSELSVMRKIVPPFQKWFGICTKGLGLGICRFENLGITGDASHRARRSCHNSAQAIDIGSVVCSGGQKLNPSSPKYFDLAYCLANDSSNELQVIFHKASGPNMIRKSDHRNHMHVQLKNCSMIYGQ